VETIDVYYLHNPETQLGEIPRPIFRRRLREAFEFLERAAGDGRIGVYGTATWGGFRQPPSERGALSLPDLFALAEEIAGRDHHFRVVQLPYNLAMTEAFTAPTQPGEREPVSLLEAARKLDVYVMTSASIYQGQLVRNLPPVLAEVMPGLATDAQRALQFVRSTPGVGTALVGLKSDAHVREAAGLAKIAPVRWSSFRKLFAAA
jgi:aryl-alcohol dehydrogenase-like predicted oxidoreductase